MSYKFSSICLKFSSAVLFLLILHTASAQGNRKNPKEVGLSSFDYLDALLVKNQKSLGNDVLGMIWTDTLVYKHELGEFDSRTVAPIGAASQWLTAAMVMKLVEDGKLSLDDKIGKYIPIFDTYGKSYITIRHCLTHNTGIQAEGLVNKKKFESLEAEVESYAKREIQSNAGTEVRYSFIGPNIAGRICEIVTKKKFDMLIKQRLFNLMAMRKTSFSNLDGSSVNPSSGAVSSADEYLHFLQMLLNNGKYNGQQILSEASVKELRRIQTQPDAVKFTPQAAEGLNYTLGGWAVDENGKGEAIALASPGLFGVFPMVDWCRHYAFLLFVKQPLAEQKKDSYVRMKEAIDDKLKAKCE